MVSDGGERVKIVAATASASTINSETSVKTVSVAASTNTSDRGDSVKIVVVSTSTSARGVVVKIVTVAASASTNDGGSCAKLQGGQEQGSRMWKN